jgi:transposase
MDHQQSHRGHAKRRQKQQHRDDSLRVQSIHDIPKQRLPDSIGNRERKTDLSKLCRGVAELFFQQRLSRLEVIANQIHCHIGNEHRRKRPQELSQPDSALLGQRKVELRGMIRCKPRHAHVLPPLRRLFAQVESWG